MSPCPRILATVFLLAAALPAAGQTTGQLVGTVMAARDSTPLAGVVVTLEETAFVVTSDEDGRFVFVGLSPGRYTARARLLGYRETAVRQIVIQAGATIRLTVVLEPAAVGLEEIAVVAPGTPLLTPDVSAGRQVVSRADLQQEPIEDIAQVLELRTGISEGHFRGGRVGQATYVIDGVDVRDQFAASKSGIAFQVAPSAVEEVAVFTSGFSADQPSALSGVVNLVTRSGPTDRWIGRFEWVTDEWAPGSVKRGYTRLGIWAGGPLIGGMTLFADLTLFGQADHDPRARGLTCLDALVPCPAERAIIPHQEGDRYFAFVKLDVPLGSAFHAAFSVNRNRDQHELYSTRFKYALPGYLAEREIATLATASLAGTFFGQRAQAIRVSARASLGRLSRYLGVPELADGGRVGRFRWSNLAFRGEDFVTRPVAEQLASGTGVPGYVVPSDTGLANPYGIFGADLFVTDGTSVVAAWNRSEFLDLALELQSLLSPQHDLKLGGDVKFHRVTTYQHVAAGVAGAVPTFVRFAPRTAAAYFHNRLYALETATIDLGVRLEAYQPQLALPADTLDPTAPVETTVWRVVLHPRAGFAMPLAILGFERAAVHWNFGRFAQPPDFRFLVDQSLDDSLNTAVRRQGNPNLGFERATQYEAGLDYLVTDDVVIRVSGFLKDLTGLTTSGITIDEGGRTFTNLDFGRVHGIEAVVEGRLEGGRRFAVGYALQEAIGVVSTAFDSAATDDANRVEVPLQFDRRHAIDLNVFWPVPGGLRIALAGSLGSGVPVPGAADRRLPWSVALSGRLTRDLHWGNRVIRVLVEGRNLLNRDNLITARLAGGVLPDVAALDAQAAAETAGAVPIPRESPRYLPNFDGDDDGMLSAEEQTAARRAALLDFHEPTLLFGEARQVRLGVTLLF